MRGVSEHIGRDEGMTLVEVVVAFAILFIIMTALLGLVGQTISMGSQATAMNVGTNAVNAYVERVRSLPFDDVFSVEATTVVTDDYAVTIVPASVVLGASDSLADMELEVTIRRGGEVVKAFSTTVVIRDRDQHLTDALRSPTTDPRVFFQAPTPPDGSVLYHDMLSDTSYWIDPMTGQSHPLVQLGLRTQLFEDRTMDVVKIQTVTLLLLKDPLGGLSLWDEPDPTWTVLPLPFTWDLSAVDASGTPLVSTDGEIAIEAYAKDSTGAESVRPRRYYIIDNSPPPAIGVGSPELAANADATRFWHEPAGSGGGTLKWLMTLDGITASDHYEVQFRRQGEADSPASPSTWPVIGATEVADPALTVPYESAYRFSRLSASVRAESIRERWTGDEAITDFSGPWQDLGGSFFTRPTLVGSTYYVDYQNANGWKITPTLTTNLPQFPVAPGTLSYEWHQVARVKTGSTWGLVDTILKTTTVNTYTHSTALDVSTGSPPSYYVNVTFKPLNEATAITIRSDTVTAITTDPGADSTLTFTAGTW
ncbi:MAG: type IV pilus modification PilV family protein [Coriobacteriia bacterium]